MPLSWRAVFQLSGVEYCVCVCVHMRVFVRVLTLLLSICGRFLYFKLLIILLHSLCQPFSTVQSQVILNFCV